MNGRLISEIFFVFLLLIPLGVMSQISFSQAMNSLYFGVDINNPSPDCVIDSFATKPQLQRQNYIATSFSLSNNLRLDTKEKVTSKAFTFTMKESPLGLKYDSGFIKVNIGEGQKIKKIINFEWYIQFNDKIDAENYFKGLKSIFSPLSYKQKFESDSELKDTSFMEFSTNDIHPRTIKNITFALYALPHSNKYGIRLFHYNSFMK